MSQHSNEELIAELYQSETWSALLSVLGERRKYHTGKLMEPSRTYPDDFYKKEVHAGQLAEVNAIELELESMAKRYLSYQDE